MEHERFDPYAGGTLLPSASELYGSWCLEVLVCQVNLCEYLLPSELARTRATSDDLELIVERPTSHERFVRIRCFVKGRRSQHYAAAAA